MLRTSSHWLLFQIGEFSTTADQIQDSAQAPRKTNGSLEKTGSSGENPTGTAGAAESRSPVILGRTMLLPLYVITCLTHPSYLLTSAQLRGQRAAATSRYPPGSAPELEEQRRVTSPQMASRRAGPMQHGTRQLLSTSLCKLAEEREYMYRI